MFVDIIQDFTVGDQVYTVGMNPNVDNDIGDDWIANGLARRVINTLPPKRPVWVSERAPAVAEPGAGACVLAMDPTRPVGDQMIMAAIADLGSDFSGVDPYTMVTSQHNVIGSTPDNPVGPDQSAALETLEDELWNLLLLTGGRGRIEFDQMVWQSRPFEVRDVIHGRGRGAGTGLAKLPTFKGEASWISVAITGQAVVGLVQEVEDLEFDGQRVGVYRGTCASISKNQGIETPLLNVVTLNGYVPEVGDMPENDALPPYTFITGVTGSPGNYSLTLSQRADYDNFNVTFPARNKPSLRFFKGTGGSRGMTGSTASRTIQVDNVVGLEVGMRAASTKTAESSRVMAVTLTGPGNAGTVDLNTEPTANGAAVIIFWTQPAGVCVQYAAITADAYDEDLKYARVRCTRIFTHEHAGEGCTVRGGRTGFSWIFSRSVTNFDAGLRLVSSDSLILFGQIGENFHEQVDWMGATPRIIAGEYYSGNDSRYPALKIIADEISIFGGECTGRIEINSTDDTPTNLIPSGSIVMMNQKLSENMVHPDATFPMCMMEARGTQRLMVSRGCMKSEVAIRWLVYFKDITSTAEINDIVLETKAGESLTLFTENLSNRNESLQLDVTNPSTGLRDFGTEFSGYQSRTLAAQVQATMLGYVGGAPRIKSGSLTITSTVAAVVRSTVLTPGQWLVTGSVQFQGTTIVNWAGAEASLTTTTGIVDSISSSYWGSKQIFASVSGNITGGAFGSTLVSVAPGTTVTINLVARGGFDSGTASVWGDVTPMLIQ